MCEPIIGIYMDYYDKETEAKIIAAHSKIDEKDALIIAEMLSSAREKLPKENCLGTRAGVMVAHALNSTSKFDRSTIKTLLGDVLTSKTKDLNHFREVTKFIERL